LKQPRRGVPELATSSPPTRGRGLKPLGSGLRTA